MTAKKEQPAELTVAEKIKRDYINSPISPLQLSLRYDVSVEEVLLAIEQGEMLEVQLVGDQVDDPGPGVQLNPGTRVRVPYTKN
jgi:hypothetical protein